MNSINSLLYKISVAYDIHANNAEIIYDGVNKIFRISTDKENFALKIFNKKKSTKYKISFERTIMDHIISNGLDCIQPIFPKSNKEQTYTFENQIYYGILTREIIGASYSVNNQSFHDFLFGQALFKLHNCPTPTFTNPKQSTSNANQLISNLKKHDYSFETSCLKKIILNLFHNIVQTPLPYPQHTKRRICHGDAWPGNALYSVNSCTLIDFEHTRISDPAFDIATFMWWLTGLDHEETQKLTAWNNFILGYGNSIESYINEHTPTLIKINQLRNLTFLHDNIIISEEILEIARQQTTFLLDRLTPYINHEQLTESLWKV
ncbi:Homoserine kinase [Pseudomonas fluorescens]|uniref:Homoserine kinase n=1 Tax=Pseudomonas fluorescens TaxID=294 RepID=A0A5E7QSG4_PSEFL|nr:phosphotransferase [Pseudomonas fluorescens]VVP65056.1 Homoserine kinase [Pseudomonas fluorescens]